MPGGASRRDNGAVLPPQYGQPRKRQGIESRPDCYHQKHRQVISLLAVALSNREELNCVINFYRIAQTGWHEKYYSVDIRGCIITDLTVDVPHSVLHIDAEPQEHVALQYREIIWTHHQARTSGFSTWETGR